MDELSRREFLVQYGAGASLAFLPAGLGFPSLPYFFSQDNPRSPSEYHLHPQYRLQRDLDSVMRKVQAGFDEFITEKYQDQVAAIFDTWSGQLRESPQKTSAMEEILAADFSGSSAKASVSRTIRADFALKIWQMRFAAESFVSRENFWEEWRSYIAAFSRIVTAEFQVTGVRNGSPLVALPGTPNRLGTRVRYELVGTGSDFHREQRVGYWDLEWDTLPSGEIRLRKWRMAEEARSRSTEPVFADIAAQAFGANPSYAAQMLHGTDYWRTVLDGACGIDIYGHNGVSVGDIDGDGFDDLYVCQSAGLPNRLYRNRGDGTFEDITAGSGVDLLENTACALFADIDNDDRQDLIVVRAAGPLLFLNEGGGKFRARPDAFQFAVPPQGTFTAAAIADYDRDGWLDIYFCLYSYYQGADQYRYPCPYYDAENGPPNFLMRNHRDGTFRDVTRETGMHKNNTRFSFACAWGDYNGDQWPDLYVVNDFGRKNLYRNNGDGTFTDVAPEAGVEDVGAGMSACWLDADNDGKEDLYVANMWTAAGNRVSTQEIFQRGESEGARSFYRKHAMGNSLLRNLGNGHFEDDTAHSGAGMGRWSWCSDSWDFDHDGFADLYIANGMVSGPKREDLNSFFWRQVVANSPRDSKPNLAYEQGWNAINELIRSDGSWSGYERNVFYLNNGDGTFSDVSAVVGLDFPEDSRTFALADFDQDGRVEVLLKNRNSPQLRYLKNVMAELNPGITIRLRGKKSNRDAIGAEVTIETTAGRQTRRVQAGSGFLAQHSKELFFGLGAQKAPVKALIRWPSGIEQKLDELPLNHRIWVEEGVPPSRMDPFRKPSSFAAGAPLAEIPMTEVLPDSAETWLLAPVAALDFSLLDLSVRQETLSTRKGKPVLLHFWSASSAGSQKELADFQASYSRWADKGLQLILIDVDEQQSEDAGRASTALRGLTFPILRSTPELIAVYNLLYRSLFDRHRDMTIPTSMLIDEHGSIVKIYQGAVQSAHFEEDFRNIPRTAAERMAKGLPFPGATQNYDFGRNYLSYGSVFFERGYLEQSEAFFQLAQREDPSGAEALYGLGSVYLQQKKNAEARKSFERAVQLQANYPGTMPKAWNNLGILAAREGRTDEAIPYFQRALEIDPSYLVALDNLGNAYRQKRSWNDAREIFQRALTRNPEDPEANYGLGMVFAQLDDPGRAYEYLQKALTVRPAYPEALNNLGVLYLRTRRPQEAEKSFQESIRVAPAFDQSYLNLARLYAIEGETQKARRVLLELLKQHPGHEQAEKELAQLPQ